MANIIQGDNGVKITFNVTDSLGSANIFSGITKVDCKITCGNFSVVKTCDLIDSTSCSVTLTKDDIANKGTYQYQLTLYYVNGNIFSTDVSRFIVDAKL